MAAGPKRRDAGLEPGELSPQIVASPALDALDGPVDPQLGVYLQEHVNVVGHDLHLDDVEAHLVRRLQRYLLEALVHAVHKHRSAVFRAEDHMVPAAVDDVVVALVFHAGIIPLADSYHLTAMRGLTPCLKEGACAALLVIELFERCVHLEEILARDVPVGILELVVVDRKICEELVESVDVLGGCHISSFPLLGLIFVSDDISTNQFLFTFSQFLHVDTTYY